MVDLPECQNVAVAAHVLADLITHLQAHGLAPEQDLGARDSAGTEEDGLLRVDPHQVAVKVGLEETPISAVPRKKDKVALVVLELLDIAHLALAEDLGAPVLGIGDVRDQCHGL